MGKISYWSITMDLIPYLFMPLILPYTLNLLPQYYHLKMALGV